LARRALGVCAALCALAVTSSIAETARADECLVDRKGLGLGFVISSRGCEHTVNIDTSLSAVTSTWANVGPRGTLELNYVHQIKGLESLHVGPLFAVSGTDLFASKSSLASVDLSTGVRTRYWLGEKDPWMFFDAAAGPIFTFPTHGLPARAGGFLELGANIHGELGAFVDAEPTVSLGDRKLGWRYSIGARTTLVGFAVIIVVYACAQANCSL